MNTVIGILYFLMGLVAWGFGTRLLRSKRPLHHHLNLRNSISGFLFLVLFLLTKEISLLQIFCLAIAVLIFSIWFKGFGRISLLLLFLGIFNWSFEGLLSFFSVYTQQLQDYSWLFMLGENYLEGALIGFAIGAVLRWIFRATAVSWWLGLCLLLAGIASLGTAWGFVLGDFTLGLWKERKSSLSRFQAYSWLGAVILSLAFLLLTSPLEMELLTWMNGGYSVQLRVLQLAVMIFGFLLFQSVWAWFSTSMITRQR